MDTIPKLTTLHWYNDRELSDALNVLVQFTRNQPLIRAVYAELYVRALKEMKA